MKKIVSVILAVLICGCLSLSAFAAGEPTFEVSSASAKAGETVDLKIAIKSNPGIASAKLSVSFEDGLKLNKVSYGKSLGGSTMQPQSLESPVVLNWVNATAELKKDTEYATLSFTVLKDAKNGAHKVSISYDPEDVYNLDEKNVSFKTIDGTITVSGGAEASSSSESNDSDGEVPMVISSAEDDNGDVASKATETGTVTTGKDINEGKGDYTGEEEIIEFEDEDGNPIEYSSSAQSNNTLVWILVCVAVALIGGGVATFIIIKKRRTQENPTEE